MKPHDIVDKLLEDEGEPNPEDLIQATDMGREGLENHLRRRYNDSTITLSITMPYMIVSCYGNTDIGGSLYSVVASWLRRKGADLPIKTFGPASHYGVPTPVTTNARSYVFELYREALQFLA